MTAHALRQRDRWLQQRLKDGAMLRSLSRRSIEVEAQQLWEQLQAAGYQLASPPADPSALERYVRTLRREAARRDL